MEEQNMMELVAIYTGALTGAKKRKSYKRSQSRAVTPADSGFKESEELPFSKHFLTKHSEVKIEEDHEDSHRITVVPAEGRKSARLKVIKEEHDKLSPDEQLLKKELEKNQLLWPRKIRDAELKRWTPIVKVELMKQSEISRLTDDWSFLDHMKTASRDSVTAKRVTVENKTEQLVQGIWADRETVYNGEIFPWERH